VDILDLAAGTHVNAATAGAVGLDDTGTAIHDAVGGEVRARNVLHQLVDGDMRIGDHRQTAVDHLGDVVRRDVGRHAHRNTAGTVDQQVGDTGRQHLGNLQGAVVVVDPVDGYLLRVRQQLMGQPGYADFGVTHGCRAVTLHRTEVVLIVHQLVALGERLGHAHYGAVDRRVTV